MPVEAQVQPVKGVLLFSIRLQLKKLKSGKLKRCGRLSELPEWEGYKTQKCRRSTSPTRQGRYYFLFGWYIVSWWRVMDRRTTAESSLNNNWTGFIVWTPCPPCRMRHNIFLYLFIHLCTASRTIAIWILHSCQSILIKSVTYWKTVLLWLLAFIASDKTNPAIERTASVVYSTLMPKPSIKLPSIFWKQHSTQRFNWCERRK